MVTSRNLKDLLEARPFRPFEICLSDGTRHAVPHPEFAWVIGGRVFVGSPAAPVAGQEDFKVQQLSILHITRVEEFSSHSDPK